MADKKNGEQKGKKQPQPKEQDQDMLHFRTPAGVRHVIPSERVLSHEETSDLIGEMLEKRRRGY